MYIELGDRFWYNADLIKMYNVYSKHFFDTENI
jgi:hypothetical protein